MIKLFTWQSYATWLIGLLLPYSAYGSNEHKVFKEEKAPRITADATFFITPAEVKENRRKYHRINRSVERMDQFTMAEKQQYNFQHLGNHWTAAQPIFYILPKHIGATDGLHVYDYYFQDSQDIRYYVTTNAYAHFNIILANLGSFIFDGCYTHRLNANWHIGGNLRSGMAENEWPHGKDNKIVNAFPHIDLFTHAKSNDGCYQLFASLSTMSYMAQETGGICSTKGTKFKRVGSPAERYASTLTLLDEAYIKNKLPLSPSSKIIHKAKRMEFHLYHHYEWSPPFQLYHECQYRRKCNILKIKGISNYTLPFIAALDQKINDNKQTARDTARDKEYNRLALHTITNEIGLKNDIAAYQGYYRIYYRLSHLSFNYDWNTFHVLRNAPDPLAYRLIGRTLPERKGAKMEWEHFIGGSTRFTLSQQAATHTIQLDGECLLETVANGKGFYHMLHITYENPLCKLSYHTLQHKVPYILHYGYSGYRPWHKDFVAPSAKKISGEISCFLPYIMLQPICSVQRMYNHIYYRHASEGRDVEHCISEPVQATAPIDLFSFGSNIHIKLFKYFHFENMLNFFRDISSGENLLKGRMPTYMYTGRLYYARQPYGKKMDIEGGINMHFKNLYYGDGYDIIAQQFYQQNYFAIQGRFIVDLFLNYRISNLKLFVKYSFINSDFTKPTAYFATPFYPGLKKAADVGIHWSFFD